MEAAPDRRRRATIVDVAAAAGVSRQTVTRALNGMPGISAVTRDRVLAACAELGYRPSRFARNIARQTTPALGLVVPSFANPYYTDLAAALIETAEKLHWQVMVTVRGNGVQRELESLVALARQVDVVVGYLDAPEEALLAAVPGRPLILLEREQTTANPSVRAIPVDLRAGMVNGAAYLLDRGHRRIGMLDAAEDRSTAAPSARQGYVRAALAAAGLHLAATDVAYCEQTLAGGAAGFAELLARGGGLDAVVAFNDYIAIGALQQARTMGVRVPEDCAVLGHDGLLLGTATAPPLTSIAIDRERIAAVALDLAVAFLDGGTPESPAPLVPRVAARASA